MGLLLAAMLAAAPNVQERVLVRSQRTGLTVVQATRDHHRVILARRAGSPTFELLLDGQVLRGIFQVQSVQVTHLFERADLLDVAVSVLTRMGENASGFTRHYLVRVGDKGGELACTFDGDADYTTAEVRPVRKEPLTFDVVFTSHDPPRITGRLQPEADPPVRIVVPDSGPCTMRKLAAKPHR